MEPVTTFAPALESLLPQTYGLLQTAPLVLHPAVERVILSGSRGIGGRPRPDSDVDLSLVVARDALPADAPEREQMLCAVVEVTLSRWSGMVECDLTAVYDKRACGLYCLAGQRNAPLACDHGERCQFGIYKLQKGFSGDVPWAIIELERMYPVLEIWRRS